MAQQTQQIRDVMTPDPVILDASASAADAAAQMRDRDVGDVLVQKDGALCGIVTDRDLVIRCMADGGDPSSRKIQDFCTQEPTTLDAGSSLDDAVDLMRRNRIRRLPILEGGKPVGIVSLGDLAEARDPKSVLGQISASPADH